MEMNQVRYFLAVCEHRNFTHAASASNVSQPSLTTAIKKLEDELGGALFIRDRAGCRLTPLGQLVKPRLERVQAETREAKAEAVRHTRLERVPIGIGIGDTVGNNKIAAAVERFRERLPQAEIELIVGRTEDLLTKLRDGQLDVVVASTDASPDLYRIDHLYDEQYRVVVKKDHDLAKLDAVTLGDLAKTTMLDRPNCEMRDTLHATFSDLGHSLYASYRSNRVDWLIDLARQGSGAVILPETAIPNDVALKTMPIEDMHIQRDIVALRYRHQSGRPEADELVKEMARR
ncbi:LysR family transcriptional regulator [uncultured Roseobacter sp.]|uniref:LysR family transcriptional regulator n=1 Tax=uncultured Roseobacter sp. TaxID=114847 RepID=UPI002611F277|nr:LysR family transcriptional regulator [uncultured Roseobacter sp.]